MTFTIGQLLFVAALVWFGWLWLEARVIRPAKAAADQARTKVAKTVNRKRTTPARRRARA